MSDSMLSQDEVDALFKQATGKSIVHAPSSAPSEKPVARPSGTTVTPSPAAPQAVPAPAPAPKAAAPPPPAVNPAAASPPPAVSSTPPPPVAKPVMPPAQEVVKPHSPSQPIGATPAISHGNNDDLVERLQKTVAELVQRLAKAEKRLAQLEQSKPGQPSSQKGTSSREVARLNAHLESMRLKLEATPGYNARNKFTCSSCGTSGQAAIPLKCTHCGEEGWWGWWPREKQEE